MKARFADNPYYLEYETMLKQLHQFIADGKGDSGEADKLRDEMDLPERMLTYEELERLRGLSADLYMLQDDEIYQPLEPGEDPAERAPDRLAQRLKEAWARGDAEATLTLLRKGSTGTPQDRVAYMRAHAYAQLGHLDTALRFIQYATKLEPGNLDYQRLQSELLTKLGRHDEAVQPAKT